MLREIQIVEGGTVKAIMTEVEAVMVVGADGKDRCEEWEIDYVGEVGE